MKRHPVRRDVAALVLAAALGLCGSALLWACSYILIFAWLPLCFLVPLVPCVVARHWTLAAALLASATMIIPLLLAFKMSLATSLILLTVTLLISACIARAFHKADDAVSREGKDYAG